MRNELFQLLGTLALAAALCGCEKAPQDHLDEARAALAAGAYGDAVTAARAGLAGSANEVTTWGLELVILEAEARAGNGAQAKAQLSALADTYPKRISATDYSSTAQLLKAADEKAVAIEVLDQGAKRFPEDPVLARMIEETVASGDDPEELEMLRSLGYIE